jgi:hypothetical protein
LLLPDTDLAARVLNHTHIFKNWCPNSKPFKKKTPSKSIAPKNPQTDRQTDSRSGSVLLPTIITLEPCALNAEFQHFIKFPYFTDTTEIRR